MKQTAIFIGLFFLGGCISLSKQEQVSHLFSPPSLEKSQKEGVDTSFLTEGGWPDKNWWHTCESEELNSLMQEAITHNLSILAVKEKIEEAKQISKVAHSRLFPFLSFDANET